MGVPIVAPAAGTVIAMSCGTGYGNCVIVDHGNGLQSLYGHMSQINAGPGQRLTQGQLIGLVGSTGFSTGPHLHFEVRTTAGGLRDPLGLLP
jgi:murein DD-endopeptidase MepM/ murein hydrolase activator NlpD